LNTHDIIKYLIFLFILLWNYNYYFKK
jgi:hypothetical protein